MFVGILIACDPNWLWTAASEWVPSGPRYATLRISSNDKHPEISSLYIALILESGSIRF